MSNFRFATLPLFERNFVRLDKQSQTVIRESLKILSGNPRHPNLRTKRVQGTNNAWEYSPNMDLRITWAYHGEQTILLRNCGHHDRTLKNP